MQFNLVDFFQNLVVNVHCQIKQRKRKQINKFKIKIRFNNLYDIDILKDISL